MAIKGTLEAFNFSTLELMTVDERRLLRKELTDKKIALDTLDVSIVGDLIFQFFIKDVELILLDHLEDLIVQFNDIMAQLVAAAKTKSLMYEGVNLHRLSATINEILPALKNNREAFRLLMSKQDNLPIRMQVLFQDAREAGTSDAKRRLGGNVFQILCELAGSKDGINSLSKINEGHVNHSKELSQRFTEGYIYHWSLEEEIKHIPFDAIFTKVPEMEKELFFALAKLLDELAKTTNAVYNLNWKHIALVRRVYCLFFELAFKE